MGHRVNPTTQQGFNLLTFLNAMMQQEGKRNIAGDAVTHGQGPARFSNANVSGDARTTSVAGSAITSNVVSQGEVVTTAYEEGSTPEQIEEDDLAFAIMTTSLSPRHRNDGEFPTTLRRSSPPPTPPPASIATKSPKVVTDQDPTIGGLIGTVTLCAQCNIGIPDLPGYFTDSSPQQVIIKSSEAVYKITEGGEYQVVNLGSGHLLIERTGDHVH